MSRIALASTSIQYKSDMIASLRPHDNQRKAQPKMRLKEERWKQEQTWREVEDRREIIVTIVKAQCVPVLLMLLLLLLLM